jgi:intracellular multiplication protein IcmC
MMGGQASMAGPAILLVAGAMLLALPDFIGAWTLAFWGSSTDLSYDSGSSVWSQMVPAVMMLVRVVGVGSFIRGVVLLARSGAQQSQPGTLGKAIIHMVAGVLCVHILGTVSLIGSILGL